jgi:Protein of unknown function (DUF3105)
MAAKGKTASKNTTTRNSGGRGNRPPRRPAPPVAVSRPKPWGLIAATVAVVLFAAGVIGYAVLQVRDKAAETPEARVAAAAKIEGVTVKSYPGGQHKPTAINYDQSPPFGGEHDPNWADCTGTVYPKAIRSENAVHSLEHGAVWITYQPGLSSGEVDALKRRVAGVDYMFMSPYPGLKTKISLQAWGHQLFVDSADDERIDTFITDLKSNPENAPEPSASCINPEFKNNPKAPDNPAS